MSNDDHSFEELHDVVHNLKAPLSAIKGYLEVIEAAGPLSTRQQTALSRALDSVERMRERIDQVLSREWQAAERQLYLTEFSLAKMLKQAVATVEADAKTAGITLHSETPKTLGTIVADADALLLAVTNLLANAVKYNHDNGDIWIKAKRHADGIEITVRDTGIGIAPVDHDRVFDRFYRASAAREKAGGAGLGLAIVRKVVQKHGGTITLSSEPGQGSTFTIHLPLVNDRPASSEQVKAGSADPALSNHREDQGHE